VAVEARLLIEQLMAQWREPVDKSAFGSIAAHAVYEEARFECADELEAIFKSVRSVSPESLIEQLMAKVVVMRAELHRIARINTEENRERVIPELTAVLWCDALEALLQSIREDQVTDGR
jgi:hypothetical protein